MAADAEGTRLYVGEGMVGDDDDDDDAAGEDFCCFAGDEEDAD